MQRKRKRKKSDISGDMGDCVQVKKKKIKEERKKMQKQRKNEKRRSKEENVCQ